MSDSPFSVDASLAASTRHLTVTADSNLFKPEINKIANVGLIKRKKIWVACDGDGNMYLRSLDDPIKIIERLAKLRKKDLITEEEFQQAKTKMLDRLD